MCIRDSSQTEGIMSDDFVVGADFSKAVREFKRLEESEQALYRATNNLVDVYKKADRQMATFADSGMSKAVKAFKDLESARSRDAKDFEQYLQRQMKEDQQ